MVATIKQLPSCPSSIPPIPLQSSFLSFPFSRFPFLPLLIYFHIHFYQPHFPSSSITFSSHPPIISMIILASPLNDLFLIYPPFVRHILHLCFISFSPFITSLTLLPSFIVLFPSFLPGFIHFSPPISFLPSHVK